MNEKTVGTGPVGSVQVFSNEEFGNVRTVTIDMAPWFVGKDVATALGYRDTINALKSHVDAEDKKGGWRITTPSGEQAMTVINESGMYALIFGSKLESAKRFKHWVTSEVLPTIRKTGSYSISTTGQQRFDLMNKEVIDVQKNQVVLLDKLNRLEESRKQDRQVIENVLFVCKQLSQRLQSGQPGSFTPRQNPKGQSEWRSELYDVVGRISRLSGLTVNCVMSQGYDYLGKNYGWFFKDARHEYVEKYGYKGDPKTLSGVDIIEASEMYKSIFMSIMKDRLEKEKYDAECKKGIVSSLAKSKHPTPIPKEMLPVRHRVEESKPASVEVVAEVEAVEVQETQDAQPRYKKYYRPSLLKPIIDPIAEKLGDKSFGHQVTYRRVYDIIGFSKIDRMTKKYIREHNKPPKSKAILFMESEKALKLFEAAANELASQI